MGHNYDIPLPDKEHESGTSEVKSFAYKYIKPGENIANGSSAIT